MVTGTFPQKHRNATILFDSSLINSELVKLMKLKSSRLDFNYEINIANGKTMTTDEIVRDGELELNGHFFYKVNLIPFGNSGFDIIVEWVDSQKTKTEI